MFVTFLDQEKDTGTLFLNYSRYFTTLIVAMIGASGAILGLHTLSSEWRFAIVAILLALASLIAWLARQVAAVWGDYVDNAVDRKKCLEQIIARKHLDDEYKSFLTLKIAEESKPSPKARDSFFRLFDVLKWVALVLATGAVVCLLCHVELQCVGK